MKAIERIQPSVVNIHGEKSVSSEEPRAIGEAPRRVNGMGTGVFIDERGFILTNFHVVEGVKKIQVTMPDGAAFGARLVAKDTRTDLAVIKIEADEPLPIIVVGSSHDLMLGEQVIAVGNAFGYENTVTRGIVSAMHRTVQVTDTQTYEDLIQTDASINPGNSGGPLINIDGEMIGINVAVRSGAAGIGFAIPVDKAMEVACELLSTRVVDHTWHGITPQWDQKSRLVVANIEEDSPASSSGLRAGDVVLAVGDRPLQRPLDLERALVGRAPGDQVELSVTRDNRELNLSLVIASLPRAELAESEEPVWDLLGLRLEPIPSKQFQAFRSKYRGGLSVVEVRGSGPAAKQGIRKGDVLVGMHVWETISLENVQYILNRPDLPSIDPLKFYILRGNETLFGNLTLLPRTVR
ncbi:MAG: trypsin-like peptidase domain-containing protein [Pirellulales bacterium]